MTIHPRSTPQGAPGDAPASGLRVGHVRGVTLTKWRAAWAERLPRVPLEVTQVPDAGVRAALEAGLVDACFARLPLDADGLHVIRLYEEAPVVLAAKDHPVAAYDSLTTADLAGELVLDADDPDALDLAAGGAGVLCVPHAVARSFSRRDLVLRHLTDAPATTIALVWPSAHPHPLVDELIGIVRGRTANSSRTASERAASGKATGETKGKGASKGTPAKGAPKGSVSAAGPARRPRRPRAPR